MNWLLLGQIIIFICVNFTAKYDAKNIVITLWFLSIRVIFTPPFVPLVTAFHQSNKGNLDDLESWGFAHQRLTSSRKFLGWSSARWHRKKNKVCLFSNVYRFRSDYLPNLWQNLLEQGIHSLITHPKREFYKTNPNSQQRKWRSPFSILKLKRWRKCLQWHILHCQMLQVMVWYSDIFLTDWIFKEYTIKIEG